VNAISDAHNAISLICAFWTHNSVSSAKVQTLEDIHYEVKLKI